jgi:hypothetical protein
MEDAEAGAPPAKRQKGETGESLIHGEVYYPYHPEDEIWDEVRTSVPELVETPRLKRRQLGAQVMQFKFTNHVQRERESIGVDMAARVAILPADHLHNLIQSMLEKYPADGLQ